MSDAPSLKLGILFPPFLCALLAGCAAAPSGDGDVGSSEAALGESATITFDASYGEHVTGELVKGQKVRVDYDASRLTACRGDQYGHPAWSITGYYRVGGGAVHTFEAGGFSPSGGAEPPVVSLDASGDLEIWFQNTSVWGCSAYDSDYGRNYHFAVAPSANAPGWMGNPTYALVRETCGADACEADRKPVTGEVLYDTWVRQRAAVRKLAFEVWKEGVTDRDNPDLWKQLDVEVHSRVAGEATWKTAYVSFERRLDHNARYAIDLTTLDPIPGLSTITDPAECPSFALEAPGGPDGPYVDAVVELYVTVNGAELRPSGPGSVFRVRYENYRGLYAPCVTP